MLSPARRSPGHGQLRRAPGYPARYGIVWLQGRRLHGRPKGQAGAVRLAEGGTIFLDEIGDVSPALQARLLRVLEQKVYEPLGGTESVKSDVRIVAASTDSWPSS